MYDELEPKVRAFLAEGDFQRCAEFFHTHFPDGRVSTKVVVYCRGELV